MITGNNDGMGNSGYTGGNIPGYYTSNEGAGNTLPNVGQNTLIRELIPMKPEKSSLRGN